MSKLLAATEIPNSFPGYPIGVRATQVADPAADSYFLTLFGRSDRVTACACERKGEVTLPQLLHLSNDENLIKNIRAPEGRLASLLKNADSETVAEQVFLATFSRMPNDAERAAIRAAMSATETAVASEKTDNREEVFADLFWALLNSKEFAFFV